MSDLINKLITECDELQEKLDKLIGFTYSGSSATLDPSDSSATLDPSDSFATLNPSKLFATLNPLQVRLLIIQRNVMGTYIEVLNKRIDTLKGTNNV